MSAITASIATALTRRKMQEELQALWEEVRFTLLFVTHSIEEALVVGSRIMLLSPHPGRVRAELNSHQFDLHCTGSADFQAAAQRIHHLLYHPGNIVVRSDAIRSASFLAISAGREYRLLLVPHAFQAGHGIVNTSATRFATTAR